MLLLPRVQLQQGLINTHELGLVARKTSNFEQGQTHRCTLLIEKRETIHPIIEYIIVTFP